jgi:hypothetical protein
VRMKYLVMHEVFGVMGVEIDNFFVSVKIKSMLQAQAAATQQISQDEKQASTEVTEIFNEELSVNITQWIADVTQEMQSDDYKLCQKAVGFWDSEYDRDQACITEDHLFTILRDRVKTINASQRMFSAEGLPGSDWNLDPGVVESGTAQSWSKTTQLIQLATQLEGYASHTSGTGGCTAFDPDHVDPKAVVCEYQNLLTLLGQAPDFWTSIRGQI